MPSVFTKMFVHCKSGVYTATESDPRLWKGNRDTFSSCFRKILHDPECHNQCCSTVFEQSTLTNNFSLIQDQSVNDDRRFECLQMGYDQAKTKDYAHFCHLSMEPETNVKSYCKGIQKRKRKRTVFTTEQIITMEGVFKKRPYVTREERLHLTQKLNVSENAIKIWFQNRRRVTERREKDQSEMCHSDSTVEDVSDALITRLDNIESYIYKNTDEFGFVTLDNNTISEIVSLIDVVLSQHVDSESNIVSETKNNANHCDSYCMYEPISPESLSEDNRETEDTLKWIPSKPEESFQRLFDIQAVIL